MLPVEFDAENAVEVMADFANALESASLEPAFRQCTPILHRGFDDNFAHTKAPDYNWPPHSPVTVAIHGPHPLLILSGALLRSVTSSGVNGSIELYAPREMEIGTSLFYAGFQEFGTNKIPARKFLWIDSNWMDGLNDAFAHEVFVIFLGS